MRLFVTGASGFIGRRFCALAVEAGHEVAGLTRAASAGRVPAGVRRVVGSLPYDVPAEAVTRADVVVHLAAITTADRAGESVAVNEVGTEFLLKLAAGGESGDGGGERRPGFVFLSTQSAHGGNNSAYAVTKRVSEEMVRGSGRPWVIVRPGLVYGPGETGLFARMRQAMRKFPVLPMLGGGRALVQAVHVDDLCAALLTIVGEMERFAGSEFSIGDPDGVSLREFMKMTAAAEGRRGRQMTVPLGPVKLGVGAAEWLGVRSPISMDNLRGLETVQRMETGESLERLGLKLRSLEDGLRDAAGPAVGAADSRVGVALIGAGKIGIVHGLQLRHSATARLACIIEPSEKAAKLYRSMGFDAPFFGTLEDAAAAGVRPEAAIIATPADTHLSVAEKCLKSGMHVLVEKPLSIDDGGEAKWRELHRAYGGQVIHCGYMAAQFPHLFTAFQLVRSHKLGEVRRVRLVALQTHITACEPVRWEMLKGRAGGGALINFGCHVASMLFRLIGWPEGAAQGWQWPIFSEEVEDALAARFEVRGVDCTLVVSWSVPGYPRPMSLVEMECENGTLRVENASVSVIQDGTVRLFDTQLDFTLSFNMAPDYTGGGFALEHEAFISAVEAAREGRGWSGRGAKYMPAVELPEALRLENWVRSLYRDLAVGRPRRGDLTEMGVGADLADLLLSTGEVRA